MNNQDYEKFKNKSLNGKKIIKKKKKIKVPVIDMKTILLTASLALGTAGTILSEKISNYNITKEYIHDNKYIVTENTFRNGDYYGYYNDGIAHSIIESGKDVDAMIYTAYSYMDYNKIGNMDEVLNCLSNMVPENSEFKDYSNFKKYLIGNGFVTEDGEIDIDAYCSTYEKYIAGLSEKEARKEKGGAKG